MKTDYICFSYSFKYLISTFKCLYHRVNAFDFGAAEQQHVSLGIQMHLP